MKVWVQQDHEIHTDNHPILYVNAMAILKLRWNWHHQFHFGCSTDTVLLMDWLCQSVSSSFLTNRQHSEVTEENWRKQGTSLSFWHTSSYHSYPFSQPATTLQGTQVSHDMGKSDLLSSCLKVLEFALLCRTFPKIIIKPTCMESVIRYPD